MNWLRLLLFLGHFQAMGFTLDKGESLVVSGTNQAILMDTSNTLTVQDVWQHPDKFQRLYHTSSKDFSNRINYKASYWIVIDLINKSESNRWFLELPDPHIGEVELFELKNDGSLLIHHVSGYLSPFTVRAIQHKNHVFEIFPDSSSKYILRLKSPIKSSFVILLKSTNYFINYSLSEFYYLGMYYGILFIMMLYNLYLFFHLKKKVQLFYVGYVLMCMLHSMQEDGIGFKFIWPEYPAINLVLYPFVHVGLLSMFLLYSIEFLQLKQKLKSFYYASIGLYLLYIIYFIVTYFFIGTNSRITIFYLIPFAMLFISAIQSYRNNNKEVRYYLLAYSSLGIGIIIFVLRLRGIIPSTLYSVYSFNVSLMLEVVIMSHALADRMRVLTENNERSQRETIESLKERNQLKTQLIDQLKEKEEFQKRINHELELKVAERTQKLSELNEELKKANEKLSFYTQDLEHMNSALDKNNWELNKEIQNKVVSNIKGNEISYEEFCKVFPHDDACLKFIAELKWKDGYRCHKCNNTKFSRGEKPYSRKCTRCGYRETATANTLFHCTRFDLNKAFYLTYLSVVGKDQYTNEEISEILKLRVSTSWQFRKKIKDKLKSQGGARTWEELVLEEE